MRNVLVTAVIVLALFSGVVSAEDNVEKTKIDYLIFSVESSKETVFIRNGSEHSGKEAAGHLQMKLQNAGSKVQTADDFIRLCASKSWITGKPYMIRSSNGRITKSEEYFRNKLKEYDSIVK
jgi:hypothetical protein